MTENELLVKTLKQFHSIEWINQYFDLLKRLLDELNLDGSDERLALSLTKQKTLPDFLQRRMMSMLSSTQALYNTGGNFEPTG